MNIWRYIFLNLKYDIVNYLLFNMIIILIFIVEEIFLKIYCIKGIFFVCLLLNLIRDNCFLGI